MIKMRKKQEIMKNLIIDNSNNNKRYIQYYLSYL